MAAFVKRIHEALDDAKDVPFLQRKNLEKHPEQLIGMCCFMIAFLSRNLEGNRLHTKKGKISKSDVAKMDEGSKYYFQNLSFMKEAMQTIDLGMDKQHAWAVLMQKLEFLEQDDESIDDVYEVQFTDIGNTLIHPHR